LYDYENNEITDLSKYTILWKWYQGNDLLELIGVDEEGKKSENID
jgi:hypothetical protein